MDDEQPRIAILGAGPIGLEAALYARYLGYPVEIFERSGQPAENVLSGKDIESVGLFAELASTLGVSALKAQNPDWRTSTASTTLSAEEWHKAYLTPLADSDLIADVLHLNTEVVAIERRDEQDDVSFQICCRERGEEAVYAADIIIDVTGIAGNRAWFTVQDADEELSFVNPDADYYILGGKCRRDGQVTFAQGLEQIRELFAILGERDDLDVYATLPPLG